MDGLYFPVYSQPSRSVPHTAHAERLTPDLADTYKSASELVRGLREEEKHRLALQAAAREELIASVRALKFVARLLYDYSKTLVLVKLEHPSGSELPVNLLLHL